MKAAAHPVLDEGGFYPHHNLYFVVSDVWDLEVLGGLLLSDIANLFVGAYCVKMRGGTYRFQAQYLRKIRVPDPESIRARDRRAAALRFRVPVTCERATAVAWPRLRGHPGRRLRPAKLENVTAPPYPTTTAAFAAAIRDFWTVKTNAADGVRCSPGRLVGGTSGCSPSRQAHGAVRGS